MKSSNWPAYLQYLGEDSTELPLNQVSEPMDLSAWLTHHHHHPEKHDKAQLNPTLPTLHC